MMRAGHAGRAAGAALAALGLLLAAGAGAPPAHGRASPEELDSGVRWYHLPSQLTLGRFDVAFDVRVWFSQPAPPTFRIAHLSDGLVWLAVAEPAMEQPLVLLLTPPVPEGFGVRLRHWDACGYGRYALLLGYRNGTVVTFHWHSKFAGFFCCMEQCVSCPKVKGWGVRWRRTLEEIRDSWRSWAPQYAAGGGWEPAWSRRLVEALSGRLGGDRTAAARTSPGARSVAQAFRIAIPALQIARRDGRGTG